VKCPVVEFEPLLGWGIPASRGFLDPLDCIFLICKTARAPILQQAEIELVRSISLICANFEETARLGEVPVHHGVTGCPLLTLWEVCMSAEKTYCGRVVNQDPHSEYNPQRCEHPERG
jgi:hypothetical protein